ncbi:hypothetical protein ACO0QE_001862 [Hanseniaspora vineae]
MSEALIKLREAIKQNAQFAAQKEDGSATDDIATADLLKISGPGMNDVLKLAEETNFGNKFTLRVIYHCWLNRDTSAADYLKECESKNIPNISFLQRTDLYNWLTGVSSELKYVESADATKDINANVLQHLEPGTESQASETISADLESQQVLNNERILLDHNSALRGSKPINFHYLIKQVDQTLLKQLKEELKNKNYVNKKKPASNSSFVQGDVKQKQKEPIIMIPSAASSLFTMANIKQFLVDGVYISPRDLPPSSQDMIRIEKKLDNIEKPLRFIVVNNTRLFSKQEYWTRVVGVFVSGHEWQFSHYKWSKPQELFQHCNGYFFRFEGDSVPKTVTNWNVRELTLDKTKRFRDLETSRLFWNSVQKELNVRGYR